MPSPLLDSDIHHLALHLSARDFSEVAAAVRTATPRILVAWRQRSLELMPDLDRLTVLEFEDSIAAILGALASAMGSRDPDKVRAVIEEAPGHGVTRFAQRVTPSAMLAEERILRTVVIAELRTAMDRRLSDEEAVSIHELLDIIGQYSVQALNRMRADERDAQILETIAGLHRLADVGVLAAGLAHDAANLMLPLRARLDGLEGEPLSARGREDLTGAVLITRQLQNFISNVRMMTVDAGRLGAGGEGREKPPPLDLAAWWAGVEPFYSKLLPASIRISGDIPADLPGPRISSACLSQILFNLVRNAEQAMRPEVGGAIRVTASRPQATDVEIAVTDDGPGMNPEILARCMEPFFTSHASDRGTGLGLAIVASLVGAGRGSVRVVSPAPGSGRGVSVRLVFPIH